MTRLPTPPALAAVACAVLALAGCQGGEPPPPEPAAASGLRVENPALGVAFASLPAGFQVEVNQGETLRLGLADRPGSLAVEVSEPGVTNLVQAVNDHKAAIEALPGGVYRGQIELGTPLGRAYASRGRFQAEDGSGKVEEMRAFVLHPRGDRTITLVYRYPAGDDSEERRDELMGALGEVEGL